MDQQPNTIINMPADMQRAVRADVEQRNQRIAAIQGENAVRAATIAVAINETRPSGMAPTLPIEGPKPEYRELTPATVRSQQPETFVIPPEGKAS